MPRVVNPQDPSQVAGDHGISFSVKQIAGTLGISESHVYYLIRQNEIHSVKVGKNRRIPAGQFELYLATIGWEKK